MNKLVPVDYKSPRKRAEGTLVRQLGIDAAIFLLAGMGDLVAEALGGDVMDARTMTLTVVALLIKTAVAVLLKYNRAMADDEEASFIGR